MLMSRGFTDRADVKSAASHCSVPGARIKSGAARRRPRVQEASRANPAQSLWDEYLEAHALYMQCPQSLLAFNNMWAHWLAFHQFTEAGAWVQ